MTLDTSAATKFGPSGMSAMLLPGSSASAIAHWGDIGRQALDAAPNMARINTDLLEIYAMPKFVSVDEVAALILLIDADVKPSLALKGGQSATHRTSETCRLSAVHPLVQAIEQRICTVIGITNEFAETVQGQRYSEGQKFGIHNDYFAAGQPYSQAVANEGGQRTWTAMVYLNRPTDGGQTAFPKTGLAIPATPGVLLIWNNNDRQGLPNSASHHEGRVVTQGRKYVLTKWFREREWQGSVASDALRR